MQALKEEMDKKEEMFEEVSAELYEKSVELEATNAKLSDTEHTLECTQVVQKKKNATEREEQKHLVEKHVETEDALKDQAKMLLETSEVSA
jgi:kinesin family protein 11